MSDFQCFRVFQKVLQAITILERAEVNEEREFFSYEHFYVVYCNFYLLDKGEKNYLTPFDLSLYSNSGKFCYD